MEKEKFESIFKVGIKNDRLFMSCQKDCRHIDKSGTGDDEVYFCKYFWRISD